MVENVYCYLLQTKYWWLVYWRSAPREDLPVGSLQHCLLKDLDLDFKYVDGDDQLGVYVDTAHSMDSKMHQSMGAHVVTQGGMAIAYKSKLQPMVATSSTNAEFIVAIGAVKTAKYIALILNKFGVTQTGPTKTFLNKMAAIMMANTGCPSECTQNIDIWHIALQEWMEKKQVIHEHIKGMADSSNVLTKALGWVLNHHHILCLMGHVGSPYMSTSGKI